jgi:hypothetical protein
MTNGEVTNGMLFACFEELEKEHNKILGDLKQRILSLENENKKLNARIAALEGKKCICKTEKPLGTKKDLQDSL